MKSSKVTGLGTLPGCDTDLVDVHPAEDLRSTLAENPLAPGVPFDFSRLIL